MRTTIREIVNRQPRTGSWFDIRAADDAATVRIYDEIGYFGVSAQDLAERISKLDVPEITVHINSPGGDVFDGLAIFNALRTHPARIVTRVDGLAASIASAIAQAGDRRVMVSSSQMMIHEAWGICAGPASDMAEFARVLTQQNKVLAELYAERSGRKASYWVPLLAAETWLTAEETVAHGLADEVLMPARQNAKATPSVDTARALAALDERSLALLDI